MALDPLTPVLVGVGVAANLEGLEAVELMALALEAAAADAGGRGLLAALDDIAVPQGTWIYPDPARLVADRVGAARARTTLAGIGIAQQTLVNRALDSLASGEAEVVAVVGGEAKRRALAAERAGTVATDTVQAEGTHPDTALHLPGGPADLLDPAEIALGAYVPVQQYAMIENALRHAEGRTPAEAAGDIDDLWVRFNAVAGANPDAAFPAQVTTEGLQAARPLAFPYRRWHSTQWGVDQAAALICCSVGAARRLGVAPDRWVFPLAGLDSSFAAPLSHRRLLHRWPAMAVLGRAAADRLGRPLADLDLLEVYSCFPAAVRVQQRELALPLDGTPTLTGGMAFAGGPFNNFVFQATAALVGALRARGPATGAVTTVSGILTKPGLAVWSSDPDGQPPLRADLAGPAAAATDTLEVLVGYRGPATVATYTVTSTGPDPTRVLVLADTPGGARVMAASDDPALARLAVTEELIGTAVGVEGQGFTV